MVKIALLRGINVGGNRKVPMADLKALAANLGFKDVENYIQSGNLVFDSKENATQSEALLEKAIEKKFGFFVDVIVRDAKQWNAFLKTPFSEAAKARPHLLHLGLTKSAFTAGAEAAIRERATHEKVKVVGQALWIDFADGVARSKLTPAFLDRVLGSTVTMRNWKTVQRLFEMVSKNA